MTKWVTFLLLLLALLAYGLSQMRPVPEGPSEATASPVAVATTSTAETPPASPTRPKSPNFGPPPAARPAPATSPGVAASPVAVASKGADPFSSKAATAPKEPVSGAIKATILSSTPDGPSLTKFAADSKEIYLTATPEGLDDELEVVASYRSILDEKAGFSSPVQSSGPPRKRLYRLTPPKEGWKTGPYQVVFKAKGTDSVVGISRFEILSPKTQLPEAYPEPEYLELVPDLEAETKPQSSFSSRDDEILLRVAAPELPAGTNIRTVWSALEVDRLTSGELIAVSNQATPGVGKDAIFTYEAPPGGYHPGSYKVEVYFDQFPAGSQVFFIEAPSAKTGKS